MSRTSRSAPESLTQSPHCTHTHTAHAPPYRVIDLVSTPHTAGQASPIPNIFNFLPSSSQKKAFRRAAPRVPSPHSLCGARLSVTSPCTLPPYLFRASGRSSHASAARARKREPLTPAHCLYLPKPHKGSCVSRCIGIWLTVIVYLAPVAVLARWRPGPGGFHWLRCCSRE